MRWYGAWEQEEWPENDPEEIARMLADFGPAPEYVACANPALFTYEEPHPLQIRGIHKVTFICP